MAGGDKKAEEEFKKCVWGGNINSKQQSPPSFHSELINMGQDYKEPVPGSIYVDVHSTKETSTKKMKKQWYQ